MTEPPEPPVEEVDVREAAAGLAAEAGAVLIDLREDFEWPAGHAEGARHVPLNQLPAHLDELPRAVPAYLICATGNRSRTAARFLRQQGFERPGNVRGGTVAWQRAGLPLSRAD